jgi:hypothetical protein
MWIIFFPSIDIPLILNRVDRLLIHLIENELKDYLNNLGEKVLYEQNSIVWWMKMNLRIWKLRVFSSRFVVKELVFEFTQYVGKLARWSWKYGTNLYKTNTLKPKNFLLLLFYFYFFLMIITFRDWTLKLMREREEARWRKDQKNLEIKNIIKINILSILLIFFFLYVLNMNLNIISYWLTLKYSQYYKLVK